MLRSRFEEETRFEVLYIKQIVDMNYDQLHFAAD